MEVWAGMEKRFLVVDFEFTFYKRPVGKPRGFFSEIIEIGAVKLDGATGETLGKVQDFVKPHFFPKQAKEAMEFCMITEKDMKKGIVFEEMVRELADLYEPGETFFTAWGDSDYAVLQEGCERHGIENPIPRSAYLDLAEAYRFWVGSERTIGLRQATEEQGVDTAGLWHTAFDDANNTGKLLMNMLAKGWTLDAYEKAKQEWETEHLEK